MVKRGKYQVADLRQEGRGFIRCSEQEGVAEKVILRLVRAGELTRIIRGVYFPTAQLPQNSWEKYPL